MARSNVRGCMYMMWMESIVFSDIGNNFATMLLLYVVHTNYYVPRWCS